MFKALVFIAAVALVFTSSPSALAQDDRKLLGTNVPITLPIQNLDENYSPVKLKEVGNFLGDYYTGFGQFSGFNSSSSDGRDLFSQLLEVLPAAWTRNQTVEIHGQRFLVTYIIEPSIKDLRSLSEGASLKFDSLKLKLWRVDQIVSIEPYPELTLAKYKNLLATISQGADLRTESPELRTVALSNIKQLATSMAIYMADYDDVMPYIQTSKSLPKVLMPYAKNAEIFKTKNPRSPKDAGFRMNMALAGAVTTEIDDVAKTPMLYDPEPWNGGTQMLVAYADTHARFVSIDEWKAMQKYFKIKLKRHGKPIAP